MQDNSTNFSLHKTNYTKSTTVLIDIYVHIYIYIIYIYIYTYTHIYTHIYICIYIRNNRSSHRRCSVRKVVLRNFAKFTGKHPCQSLFFDTVAGLRPGTLIKKRLWYRYFPVNFAKFLRTPYLQNTSGRMFLKQTLTRMN